MILRNLEPRLVSRSLELKKKWPRLSAYDAFCLALAEDGERMILLTGDLPLRRATKAANVEVHGVLWVIDEIDGHRILPVERPRSGMREVGVRPDTLLFFGVAVGAQYEGTAYIFSRKCGALPYHVNGPILGNYRCVVMYGQAPRVDGACRVVGYQNDVLEFSLID